VCARRHGAGFPPAMPGTLLANHTSDSYPLSRSIRNVNRRNSLVLSSMLLVWLAAGATSCAVGGGAPGGSPGASPPSWPASKVGLPAQLRVFHDELEPHGDWVLVEPHGWVFRPRVNTVAWRPYRDGRWAPSYSYGWVWESDEPFGWITDHYGFWFRDEFQGWVWKPYGAWAPAWVAWVQVGDFVGWSPLPPEGAPDTPSSPDGAFTYVSRQSLGGAGAAARASFVRDIPDDPAGVRPIDRVSSHQGIYWNAGPDPKDILGPAVAERLRLDERDGRIAPPGAGAHLMKEQPPVRLAFLEQRTTRAWSEARRELLAERARRQGARPGAASEPPRQAAPTDAEKPRFRPAPAEVDSTGAPGDSLRRLPREPRRGPRRPARPGSR